MVVTVMACASQLDASLEEAARSLGASPWRIMRDVILPALAPGLIAAGAVCFATAMGTFGTAFTLATDIDVLPMTIYTEFTLNANMVTAAGLSIVPGFVTWAVLMVARFGGTIASAVPAPAHQVTLDLCADGPSAFSLEPPAFALHRYDPRTGIVTHHAYVDDADGPYPFHDPSGDLIA